MISEDVFALVVLSRVRHLGPIRTRKLIERFGSPHEILKTPIQHWGLGKLGPSESDLHSYSELALTQLEWCYRMNIRIVGYHDKDYPRRLTYFDDSPLYFLSRGVLQESNRTLAIVGTRSNTNYGSQIVQELLDGVHHLGCTVVSGLALGIDSFAHQGALDRGMNTWACLAHGHEQVYPPQNRDLLREIEHKGCAISEHMPYVKAERDFFPLRNRLIAALSDVILVVESACKGGALVTAQFGNEYNKEVVAVPGKCGDLKSEGCNELIRQNKAVIYSGISDLLKLMNWSDTKSEQLEIPVLNNREYELYQYLLKVKSIHVDELKMSVNQPDFFTTLLQLEMKGILVWKPGNRIALV
jgi:DNA processing protein